MRTITDILANNAHDCQNALHHEIRNVLHKVTSDLSYNGLLQVFGAQSEPIGENRRAIRDTLTALADQSLYSEANCLNIIRLTCAGLTFFLQGLVFYDITTDMAKLITAATHTLAALTALQTAPLQQRVATQTEEIERLRRLAARLVIRAENAQAQHAREIQRITEESELQRALAISGLEVTHREENELQRALLISSAEAAAQDREAHALQMQEMRDIIQGMATQHDLIIDTMNRNSQELIAQNRELKTQTGELRMQTQELKQQTALLRAQAQELKNTIQGMGIQHVAIIEDIKASYADRDLACAMELSLREEQPRANTQSQQSQAPSGVSTSSSTRSSTQAGLFAARQPTPPRLEPPTTSPSQHLEIEAIDPDEQRALFLSYSGVGIFQQQPSSSTPSRPSASTTPSYH